MAQEVFSRARAISSGILDGVFHLAKSVLPSTGPPRATFTRIDSPSLGRLNHTLCVVNGRAYLFGGETSSGKLASNNTDMLILPSSAVLSADYATIPAKSSVHGEANSTLVPASRRGHGAAIIGDDVYVFGGEDGNGKPVDAEEHQGRVWVFESRSNAWTALDPAEGSPVPPARAGASLASSELPGPIETAPIHEPLPQTPMDPAQSVPDIPDRVASGTLFVVGGRSLKDGSLLNDAWAFDVKSRSWMQLASPPEPARESAALAVAGGRLYRFGGFDGAAYLGGGIDSFDLSGLGTPHIHVGEDGLSRSVDAVANNGWEYIAYLNGQGPRDRSGAGLIPVETGLGRNHYLLVVGGEVESAGKLAYFDDVWAYQLPIPSAGPVAAATTEVSKRLLASNERDMSWAEVQYQYIDANGDTKTADEASQLGGRKGMGGRGRFAISAGSEVDGASVVVWGGVAEGGRVCTDGWLITVER